MVDFLGRRQGLTKHQAYQLTSIAGHVAITQLVDLPNMGVHVKMPKSIFNEVSRIPESRGSRSRLRARASHEPS